MAAQLISLVMQYRSNLPARSGGFTLVELVAIIVILGVLVFVSGPTIGSKGSALLTSRDGIIAALSQAQQIAMARDSADNPVTLVISANAISLHEDGALVSSPGAEYPFTFPSSVSVTAGAGTLHYDKLGRTQARTIVLNNGGASITVEESGYAH